MIVGCVSYATMGRFLRQKTMGNVMEIVASAGTVGERVDYVYKDIQSIVDIVAQNTNDLKEIHVSSRELNETAKSSAKKIEENVENMSAGMQKERADAFLFEERDF